MRKLIVPLLLAGGAALSGCMTYPEPTTYNSCGTYGYIDSDNDGWVEANEWNAYRAGSYSYWDADADGRIERSEFQNCWNGGGFYPATYYNRDYGDYYWSAFDANMDGYLSADEYWSANAWTRLDVNRNGRLDANEYRWW